VDIIEVERVKKSLEAGGQAFQDRVFTHREIEYCEARKAARYQSYAARFAAKEAVSKAFGTGICGRLSLIDIEILNDDLGKPYVALHREGLRMFEEIKGRNISISLSHCKSYAVAYTVLEVEG